MKGREDMVCDVCRIGVGRSYVEVPAPGSGGGRRLRVHAECAPRKAGVAAAQRSVSDARLDEIERRARTEMERAGMALALVAEVRRRRRMDRQEHGGAGGS